MAQPPTVTGEQEAPAAVECPRCGSEAGARQEYCLECGARLPPTVPTPPGRTGRVREGARESLLTVLVAFVVAVIAAAAVVAVQMARDDDEQPLLVPSVPQPEPAAETEPPVETALPPEEEEPGVPPEAEEPEPEPPAPPPQQQVIEWPQGTDGFTVVIESIPTGSGRAAAVSRARQARDGGLQEVGVLVSADYASLRPGYFVVFSGVHATRADAEQALGGVVDAGNQGAYVAEVTR